MELKAFLFPGQGSQSVGMMSGLAEAYPVVRETFDQASAVLGQDLWAVCENGPEEDLNQTEVTQPAMLAAGVATWRAWQSEGGGDPDFVAGHSLGEYSALVVSGVLDFDAAIGLVAERGRLMKEAVPPGHGAMAAILGLENDVLEAVCSDAAEGDVVSCANFNSPGQTVIAGSKAAVDRACDRATEAGARRAVPLAVSVPSHCLLMKPAAVALSSHLDRVAFKPGRIPVVSNVDVAEHGEAGAVRDALMRQMWNPVRWSESIEYLVSKGVTEFAECGPGKVLSGLNRRISREVSCVPLLSAEDLRSLQQTWSSI